MAINFNRKDTQLYCEEIARIADNLDSASNAFSFRGLSIDDTQTSMLKEKAKSDATGYFYNAIISFYQGCNGLCTRNYSWALVQLYYSLYYSIRAQLYYDFNILVRKDDLFDLKIEPGSVFHQRRGRNDHSETFKLFRTYSSRTPFLLTNNIDGISMLDWMESLRNAINYRQVHFLEPYNMNILNTVIARIRSDKTVTYLLNTIKNDFPLYCFQEEYAFIASPYYQLSECSKLYLAQTFILGSDQIKYIRDLEKKYILGNLTNHLLS